jgi:hypothetical protein
VPTVGWYLKRIRVMSGRELFHRAGQLLAQYSMFLQFKLGVGIGRPPPASSMFRFCSAREQCLPRIDFDAEALSRASEALLRGEVAFAGETWKWDESGRAWRRDPCTGREWPAVFFARIPYREGNPFGDIRIIWEPSRLQQLVDLAMLAQIGEDSVRRRAVEQVTAQLASWVQENPPLKGPHYISAMECSLRLIAVCHALDLLRNMLNGDVAWQTLIRMLASHAPLIERRLSQYSSTGNHTVAEAAGLAYAGLLFPEMHESERWLSKGLSILEKESAAQVLPDGGGIEQALGYHVFNIHLLWLVKQLLVKQHQKVPNAIADAIDRGCRFLRAMQHFGGGLLALGDNDGGAALSRYMQLDLSDDRVVAHARTFEQSGYTVARIGDAPVVGMVFDHGPLGMPPGFGHGHADALSVLLTVEGEPIIIDTGTYTYTANETWRRYFRGTTAHNTVVVDGRDQARQEGCFLWSKPYMAGLVATALEADSAGHFLALHDGYGDLGVRHWRGIAWQRGEWLLVWDRLSGTGTHELELHWHLRRDPEWLRDGSLGVQVPGGTLTVHCEGGQISSHSRELAPTLGWQSPSYGCVEAATTIRLRNRSQLPHEFVTMIEFPRMKAAEHTIEDALNWMRDRAE